MISKELLDSVLSIDSKLEIEYDDENVKFYITPKANSKGYYEQQTINIYELAHKCKEWVNIGNNKSVFSGLEFPSSSWFKAEVVNHNEVIHRETSLTETEAIFKACEWMLIEHDENRED